MNQIVKQSLIFILLFPFSLFSQNAELDSLRSAIELSSADTSKVNALLLLSGKLCREYPDEAVGIATEAKDLAEKLDFQKGIAYSLKALGMPYYFQGDYITVLVFWKQSYEKFEAIGDKKGMANMLNNIGAIYFNGGDYTNAVDNYIKSLRVGEQINDTLRIATALVNIGAVYYNKPATHSMALEYYKRALPLSEALGDNDAIGTTAVNMGEIYFARNDLDSALLFYERSLEAYRKSETGNIPYTLNNIGKVYATKGNIRNAIDYQNEAYEIAKERQAKLEMAQSLIGLANTYSLARNIPASIDYFRKAEPIAEEIQANEELSKIYKGLTRNYKSLSNYEQAFNYQSKYETIQVKIYDAEMEKGITTATLSYDIEKKQGQIDLMTKEKELVELNVRQQKLIRNALIVFLVLVLIITIGAIRNYLNKVKVNKVLDKQKAEIEGLLLNILPEKVAHELQMFGYSTPRNYELVSVLFTDFKSFTSISSGMTPKQLVEELNTFFQAFDNICETYNLEKIKTIGDSFMCAGGIPKPNTTNPVDAVRAGLEMQKFVHETNEQRKAEGKVPWDLRIGINTGPVLAGVVGKKKYAYDIWGSAVNLASRMESNGEPGKVNISENTYELVKDKFVCQHRGKILAKNIGEVDMYFVLSEIKIENPILESVESG
ncbi:MAG TPA: adenylate/guanylate cyclase domain-containing protein [Bacteroidales bacterium]